MRARGVSPCAFAATSLASQVSAQSVPKPADQAQPSTRSDDDSDGAEAGERQPGTFTA